MHRLEDSKKLVLEKIWENQVSSEWKNGGKITGAGSNVIFSLVFKGFKKPLASKKKPQSQAIFIPLRNFFPWQPWPHFHHLFVWKFDSGRRRKVRQHQESSTLLPKVICQTSDRPTPFLSSSSPSLLFQSPKWQSHLYYSSDKQALSQSCLGRKGLMERLLLSKSRRLLASFQTVQSCHLSFQGKFSFLEMI